MQRGTKVALVFGGVASAVLAVLLLGEKDANAAELDPEAPDELDPSSPPSALESVAEQTGAPVVVADPSGNIVPLGPDAIAQEVVASSEVDEEVEDVEAAAEMTALDAAAEAEPIDEEEAIEALAAVDDEEELASEKAPPVYAPPVVTAAPPVAAPPVVVAPPLVTAPEWQPNQEAAMLQSLLIRAEQGGNWKASHQEAVKSYQEKYGLKADGKFGPGTALHLGLAAGDPVPVVRYWPADAWGVGSKPYKDYIAALVAAGLDSSVEKGQGFGSKQKAVVR